MAPQSVLTVTDHDAVVDVVAVVAAEVARTENPVTHERLLRYAYQFFFLCVRENCSFCFGGIKTN